MIAAAVLVPLALPKGDQRIPSAGPSASGGPTTSPSQDPLAATSATPDDLATPTDVPETLPSETPTRSPQPIVVGGWPIKWTASDTGWTEPAIAPDGTVFLSEGPAGPAIAIDASGRERSGWLRLPDAKTLAPVATGSDGTMYVTEVGEEKTESVYAFGPDGNLKPGWPVELPSSDPILPGPAGTLYTTANGALVVYGPDGKVRATGEQALDDLCILNHAAIRADGVIFVLCWADSAQTFERVAVFDSNGRRVAGASAELWSGITMGAGGTVAVWRNQTIASGDGFTADQTFLSVIGTDGKPLPGWLKSVGGPASVPVVAPDGSVYILIERSERSSPAAVIGWNADGSIILQYGLDAGFGPRMDGTGQPGMPKYPVPPVLGRNGTVYLVTDDAKGNEAIVAVDAKVQNALGRSLPGWPVALPARITHMLVGACTDWCGPYYRQPLFVVPASGQGLLYLHLGDQILALTEDGQVAPGWPKKLPATNKAAFYGWTWWAATPDGGLVTLEEWDWTGAAASYVLTRWAPDGSMAH